MAEPLEKLIPHVRPERRHRRATWQPVQVTGDLTPGQQGQMSALEARAMNDAYVPDIGSAAPPTRMASGESMEAPEDEAQNPFMFASQKSGGRQQTVVQNGIEYQKICDGTQCYLVPVDGGQQQPMQPQSQQQLPPGVVVNPGEIYDPQSLRVTTRQLGPASSQPPSSMQATTQPAVQSATTATVSPAEQQVAGSLERSKQLADRIYGDAIQAFSSMTTAPSAQAAVAFRVLGDAHMQVGNQVFEQIQNESLMKQAERLEGQANEILALKDPVKRQAKDAEVITSIRSGEGSVAKRAQDVVTYRLRSMPDNIQISSDDWGKMVAEEAKVVSARDIASSLDAARALGRTIDSNGGKPTYEQQVMQWRFANEIRLRLNDRYKTVTDPNLLRMEIAGELGKTYEYSIRKDLEARGFKGDELEYRSAFDTRSAIDTAVAMTMRMQRGESPELAPPPHPMLEGRAAQAAPQAAPQEKPKTSSWWDSLIIGPQAW